ncbi:hypothetical protein GCM10023310_32920 [Paenibacillus vulneris]
MLERLQLYIFLIQVAKKELPGVVIQIRLQFKPSPSQKRITIYVNFCNIKEDDFRHLSYALCK